MIIHTVTLHKEEIFPVFGIPENGYFYSHTFKKIISMLTNVVVDKVMFCLLFVY